MVIVGAKKSVCGHEQDIERWTRTGHRHWNCNDSYMGTRWLQGVDELWVLAVRQVQPLLVLHAHVARCRADGGFLLVLLHAVHVDEEEDAEAHAPADDDGDFSRNVAGRVARTECLWACSVLAMNIHTVTEAQSYISPEIEVYSLPIMLPTQYPIRYIAATVVFLV